MIFQIQPHGSKWFPSTNSTKKIQIWWFTKISTLLILHTDISYLLSRSTLLSTSLCIFALQFLSPISPFSFSSLFIHQFLTLFSPLHFLALLFIPIFFTLNFFSLAFYQHSQPTFLVHFSSLFSFNFLSPLSLSILTIYFLSQCLHITLSLYFLTPVYHNPFLNEFQNENLTK